MVQKPIVVGCLLLSTHEFGHDEQGGSRYVLNDLATTHMWLTGGWVLLGPSTAWSLHGRHQDFETLRPPVNRPILWLSSSSIQCSISKDQRM